MSRTETRLVRFVRVWPDLSPLHNRSIAPEKSCSHMESCCVLLFSGEFGFPWKDSSFVVFGGIGSLSAQMRMFVFLFLPSDFFVRLSIPLILLSHFYLSSLHLPRM